MVPSCISDMVCCLVCQLRMARLAGDSMLVQAVVSAVLQGRDDAKRFWHAPTCPVAHMTCAPVLEGCSCMLVCC
jgi:hypothetical protein